MRALLIALGQLAAGDDGAGPLALERARERIRELDAPPDVELTQAGDATRLLDLLRTPARVVILDAVIKSPAGEVLELDPAALAEQSLASVSSHGLSVGQAIALARELDGDALSRDIHIIAITIDRPPGYSVALSPAVASAVERAAEIALRLVRAAA